MTVTTQRRLHRARAAAFLAPLQEASAKNNTTGEMAEQADIEWSALDAVPHWCFEPPSYIGKLQLVCGAIFLAPAIRNWIEGRRIQEVRALIGPTAFAAVARSSVITEVSAELEVTEEVPAALAKGGASVLLNAIENDQVKSLLALQFPMDVEAIDHEIAKGVYELSVNIVHQAIVKENMASNDTQNTTAAESS